MKITSIIKLLLFIYLVGGSLLFAGDNLEQGIRLFNQGKYEQAKDFFKEKVKENGQDDLANNYLGRC